MKNTARKVLSYAVPCVLLAAMLIWFVISVKSADASRSERELTALKNSVENSITMCYAFEGAYPESVEYLVSNYGLIFDNDKYIIHYDVFAPNLRPTVVVLERQT